MKGRSSFILADTGTSGKLTIDDFESRRFSYIGLLVDPGQDLTPPVPETGSVSYHYDGTSIDSTPYPQPHAVTSLTEKLENGNSTTIASYVYDKNGNPSTSSGQA